MNNNGGRGGQSGCYYRDFLVFCSSVIEHVKIIVLVQLVDWFVVFSFGNFLTVSFLGR